MPADVRDFHLRNICQHSYFHGYYSATVGNGMGYPQGSARLKNLCVA